MTRSVLNTFASLTNPTLPNLDADFLGVANTLVVPCTVTGTNAISLTPVNATVNVTAYTDKDQYTFFAGATSTGSMTLQVSGLGLVNLYKSGGTVQAGSGDVVSGQFYQVAYGASLNSGQGGFVIVSAILANTKVARTRTVLTFGSGLTYTTPANALYLNIRMVGGGGGGGGAGTGSPTSGGTGGSTVFSTFVAAGGGGGSFGSGVGAGNGGFGGAASGSPNIGITGGSGDACTINGGSPVVDGKGGGGAASAFGGAGGGGGGAGASAATNSGAGGAGAPGSSATFPGCGGGAGAYVETLISPPSATYLYTVASGGTAGNGNFSGAYAGGAGIIIVDEFYN